MIEVAPGIMARKSRKQKRTVYDVSKLSAGSAFDVVAENGFTACSNRYSALQQARRTSERLNLGFHYESEKLFDGSYRIFVLANSKSTKPKAKQTGTW